MPNQPDPNKVLVGVRTPRELAAALRLEAQEHGLKLPGLIVRILQQYVGDPAKRLSRFELEDIEQERFAAQQESGSRRSRQGGSYSARYREEMVTGEAQAPLSDTAWRTMMNCLASGWRMQEEADGFRLSNKAVPGCVGLRFQNGAYVMYAHYWGEGAAAEFAKPLKWRYGGARSYGCWHTPLHSHALGLNLRAFGEGELYAYLRSGKDDAAHKITEKLRELIACLRAQHRRARWLKHVEPEAQAAAWTPYIWEWRILALERTAYDSQLGKLYLDTFEPLEGETVRLALGVRSGSSAQLRRLLQDMGKPELAEKVRDGLVRIEEFDFETRPDGERDEEATAALIAQTASKWMQAINSYLSHARPLRDFAALAVETANSNPASICSIGLVIVRGGQIAKRWHRLVCPAPAEFEFTELHGIGAQKTQGKPCFAEVWSKLMHSAEKLPLVIHTGFTERALRAAHEHASLPWPDYEILRTIDTARRKLDLPAYNLPAVAEALGHPIASHHALNNAMAIASIAVQLFSPTPEKP